MKSSLKKYIALSGIIFFVYGNLNWSCRKGTKFERNYFMFGSSYSECEGNCASFYMIQGDDLYGDEMSFYDSKKSLKFKRTDLGDEKFEIAKKIMDNFPEYLIQHPNQTFGCPDCRDQGSVHIETKVKGKLTKWDIDNDIQSLPAELRNFVVKIQSTISELEK